ncbi:MAG: alpha/beta hydrolase [Acidobacteria bacterium]|nr:alpha/beta hydrolase [Acidobacteriota bacterium]
MNRDTRHRRRCPGVIAMLLALAAPVLAVEPQTVTFNARDGAQITGTLFLPDRHPAPAVVLLHMMARSRHDWDAAAQKLVEAGIAALSVDFRRAGQPGIDARGGDDLADLVLDAEAAKAYLSARPEIAPGRIGIAGASVGANVAAIAAGNDASVRSLALLSPSLEYRNLRMEPALRKFGSRPALLVASSEDPYALRSARGMVTMGNGPRELRVLAGAGHGTLMLSRDPDLATAVVEWFVRTL